MILLVEAPDDGVGGADESGVEQLSSMVTFNLGSGGKLDDGLLFVSLQLKLRKYSNVKSNKTF